VFGLDGTRQIDGGGWRTPELDDSRQDLMAERHKPSGNATVQRG